MTPGVYTWDELGSIDGNVLVVLNSASADTGVADALFEALEPHVSPQAMHVIAERPWAEWLSARSVAPDRVLFCADYEGRDVEVNFFLESPDAVLWAVEKQFRMMVGSDPHDLYNERVNHIVEQRALLLLDEGHFLAHTLPNAYLYAFDTPRLLERSGRDRKVRAYDRASRAIIDDLHNLWVAAGSPPTADHSGFDDVLGVLTNRLGAPVVAYDEGGPIPLEHEPLTDAYAEVVAHLRTVVREHDRQLRVWSAAYAERKEAADIREEGVRLRDTIIDDLRLQLEPLHRKLRRRWRERRG